MERKLSTSSTAAPVYTIESLCQCAQACSHIEQCQAYTRNSTTCTLYSATRYQYRSTILVRSGCSGFVQTPNMAGDDSRSLSYSATLESCESVCLRIRLCKATVFDSSALTCSLYSSNATQKDDNPSLTMSLKISDEGEVFTVTSKNDDSCSGQNGLTRLSSTLHMSVLQLLCGLLASLRLASH